MNAEAGTSAKQTADFDATAERIRELNDRIIEAARKAGDVYLDTYEKTLKSIADFQENVAEHSQAEWFSNALSAQADFTREMAKLYTSAAREFIKR
jgi:hypothetical protein